MDLKQTGLTALSVGVLGLLFYGKYKLATAKPLWWVLILGALVFVASTPAKAE